MTLQNDNELALRITNVRSHARVQSSGGSGYAPLSMEQLARAARLARHPAGQLPKGVRLGRNQWANLLADGMAADSATVYGLPVTVLDTDDACEWVYG